MADAGGWESDETVDRFADFCARAAAHLGADRIARACTINEHNIVGVMGYLLEAFPPGVCDRARADDVLDRAGFDLRAERDRRDVVLDTPGQIEIFTWSASGAIITDAVASSFPTVVAYIVDTPRTTAPATFMSNMLYACR